MAWQRHPPKSISLKAQERQGSFIQEVPRKALNALEFSQISRSGLSLTLSKLRNLMLSAAWQGSTLPDGVMFMKPLPQPPMQGFGRLA